MHFAADGDQHYHPTKADEHTGPKFAEGQPESHVGHDPKDTRSLSNRANAEKAEEKREEREEQERIQQLPTEAARRHGNEPSKGAKVGPWAFVFFSTRRFLTLSLWLPDR